MLAPHVKGFSGALEETIIVLLERSNYFSLKGFACWPIYFFFFL